MEPWVVGQAQLPDSSVALDKAGNLLESVSSFEKQGKPQDIFPILRVYLRKWSTTRRPVSLKGISQ